jgi:hypothetical protein
MNLTAEDLHHRLDQLRLLASETDDPLAERLVRDLIVELEDMLSAHGARKAVVCSRPREGPSHRGEVRHDRRASRAFSISHLTLASFMEDTAKACK